MQKEKWKNCIDARGYLISSWGRIFSLKSKKFLRSYIHQSRSGKYLRIELSGKKYMLHILVGRTFKMKELTDLKRIHPIGVFQMNHDDRNTLNCNLNNLTWMIEKDNMIHMVETSSLTFGGKTYKGKFE